MKTEIINQEQEVQTEWDFPCLGKSSSGMIVLFSAKGEGTLLLSDSYCIIGSYSVMWYMNLFKPLKGETTIKFIP